MGSVCKGISAGAASGKNLITNSPLASNVLLGLILTGLEKLVDIEFACPCDPAWNALCTSMCFVVPGLAAPMLMLSIQRCTCKNFLLFGLVPPMMWLILVFLDGQYYACAHTSWSGRFVIIDKAHPQRWCEPDNSTLFMERMVLTQKWYSYSQVIGVVFIAPCSLLIGIVTFLEKRNKGSEVKTSPSEEPAQEQESLNL